VAADALSEDAATSALSRPCGSANLVTYCSGLLKRKNNMALQPQHIFSQLSMLCLKNRVAVHCTLRAKHTCSSCEYASFVSEQGFEVVLPKQFDFINSSQKGSSG
jgi:hypothetical protein